MTVQPKRLDELQDAVRAHASLVIRGAGTKSAPIADAKAVTLDTRGLSGVTDYSPDECVLTALGGTPLSMITEQLAAHGQYLPFDPPLIDAGATIGGTVATGLSGSGRHRYGGVRDFVIGMRIVDGEGRLIRSGGKVVKNAAGFLLHHGMVGSLGRFGVIAEVTLKVFPAPQVRGTVRVECRSVACARSTVRGMQGLDLEAVDFDSLGTLWIRVAGRAEALDERISRVMRAVGGMKITGPDEEAIWADAREFRWVPAGSSLIKVPGDSDELLTSSSRVTSAGTVSWIAVDDLRIAGASLQTAGRSGLVVRGPQAATLIGRSEPGVFEQRVRSVLDPRNRFSAAPDRQR